MDHCDSASISWAEGPGAEKRGFCNPNDSWSLRCGSNANTNSGDVTCGARLSGLASQQTYTSHVRSFCCLFFVGGAQGPWETLSQTESMHFHMTRLQLHNQRSQKPEIPESKAHHRISMPRTYIVKNCEEGPLGKRRCCFGRALGA